MMKVLTKKFISIGLLIAIILVFIGVEPVKAEGGQLKVHYIDVGDADCMLIQQGDKSMLIDAGNNLDEQVIKRYLSSLGVKKLDILIGTHVDEDHIGSMDAIINYFEIGKVYLPGSNEKSKYLEDILKALDKKGLQITAPVAEQSFKLGDAVCTILAPIFSGYERENNYSIVIKLKYGKTSFMFTGDAEVVSEKEMMRRGFDLSADVIKIGHHGSIRSTTDEFLNRVNPQYAIISVGKRNSYRHPHKRTMEKLKKKGIKVYRTDENGTVVATSDGEKITFNKKPGSYNYKN